MSYDFPMTEAELTNFTTAFYAEIGDGKVTTQKLQQLADAITQPGTIPYDKLEAIVNEISPSSEKGNFDFPKMLRLLADAIRPPDVDVDRELLVKALTAYDHDEAGLKKTGSVPVERIGEILRETPGLRLSDKDITDIVGRCDPSNEGKVKVEALANLILA